jgi:hypothetical protein
MGGSFFLGGGGLRRHQVAVNLTASPLIEERRATPGADADLVLQPRVPDLSAPVPLAVVDERRANAGNFAEEIDRVVALGFQTAVPAADARMGRGVLQKLPPDFFKGGGTLSRFTGEGGVFKGGGVVFGNW